MSTILSPPSFLTSLFLFLLISSSPISVYSTRCDPSDEKALLAIKAAFSGSSHFASWTVGTDCCDWYGVSCVPGGNRVTSLSIFADPNLKGTIPTEICDLPFLQTLILHRIPNLSGPIPSSITNLRRLTVLDLSRNSLSGPVPPFLSQLSSLTFLNLAYNRFSGPIPSSLSSLHSLTALRLDHNQLTGPIPDSFGQFAKSGPPNLYLSHNSLSGPVPASLGSPQWDVIDLSSNRLAGDASFLFGSGKPTFQIDLSRNRFSFDLGKVSFPANLTYLDLSHNGIFGSIPAQINQVAGLQRFNVSYNRLCGRIPAGPVTGRFDKYSYQPHKCLCGAPLAPCK